MIRNQRAYMESISPSGTQIAGFWEWEDGTDIIAVSEGIVTLLGFPRHRLSVDRQEFLDRIAFPDRQEFILRMQEAIRKGKSMEVRHGMTSLHGCNWHATTKMERLAGMTGCKWRLAAAVMVMEMPDSQEIDLSEFATNIVESAPVGIAIIDETTHQVVDINEAGSSLIGLPKAAIIGGVCHTFMCPDEKGKCPITDLGQDMDNSERILVRSDGSRIPILKTVIGTNFQGRRRLIEVFIDMRARKQIEQKLLERDARLAEAERHANFGTWEWCLDTDRIFLSDGFCRILEADQSDFAGGFQSLMALIHPDNRRLFQESNLEAIERGKPYTVDVQFCLPNGEQKTLFIHGGCAFDPQGKADRLVGIVQDVTMLRQREENFLAQNEFLTTVIESFAQPFYVIDAESYAIVYANTSAIRTIGGDWESMKCYEWTHKEDKPCSGDDHICPLEEVKRTLKPVVTEHQHYDRDGNIRHYAVYGYPILNAQGDLVQLIEYTRDITQQRNMRTALRMSEEKYRKLSHEFNVLLDAIPDRIMLISPELKILWANRQARMDTAVKESEAEGQNCYNLRGQKERCRECPVITSLHSGKVEEVRMSFPDGKFWEMTAVPILDEKGKIARVIEIASDITDKVTLQADALRAGHMASLGELAAGVAHEINNPINSIINFAQILADEIEQKGMESDIPAWIMKEGDRVASIVQSLLSFARQRETTEQHIRLHEVVTEALALTGTQLRKSGITLKLDVPESLPEIRGNFQKIQQVFLNIINNARYALNKKYPSAAVEKMFCITGQLEEIEGKPWVRISFLDHGMGIPAHLLDKVILPFFSTKPADRGTGLGLTISHNIITDHGGKLRIQSEEGIHTEVIVLFPAFLQS